MIQDGPEVAINSNYQSAQNSQMKRQSGTCFMKYLDNNKKNGFQTTRNHNHSINVPLAVNL